eukprot:1395504-Prymnesium_polylepis.1
MPFRQWRVAVQDLQIFVPLVGRVLGALGPDRGVDRPLCGWGDSGSDADRGPVGLGLVADVRAAVPGPVVDLREGGAGGRRRGPRRARAVLHAARAGGAARGVGA